MSDSIVKYYLLCTVRLGGKRHMLNDLEPEQLTITLTKKELSLYLRKHDGQYIINDTVVGGADAVDPIIVM